MGHFPRENQVRKIISVSLSFLKSFASWLVLLLLNNIMNYCFKNKLYMAINIMNYCFWSWWIVTILINDLLFFPWKIICFWIRNIFFFSCCKLIIIGLFEVLLAFSKYKWIRLLPLLILIRTPIIILKGTSID